MAAIVIAAVAAAISLSSLFVQARNADREYRRSVGSANYNERLVAYGSTLSALTRNMSLISSWAAAKRDTGLAGQLGPIYVELERARSDLAASREVAQLTDPAAVVQAFLAVEGRLRAIIGSAVEGRLAFDSGEWNAAYGDFVAKREAYVRACRDELARVRRAA